MLPRCAPGLVAGLLAACGGSSSDPADPPADPGPAAISFQLMPARLPLGTGTAGQLLPLQAPGTLVWSSSDPAVASVDADGQVTALAAGSAVITASAGASSASARVAVFAPTAASSASLIDTALAQGTIDAEQALTYRCSPCSPIPRLPPQFEGAPEGVADHALMRRLSVALPTLSAATAGPPRAVPGAADLCRELVRAAPQRHRAGRGGRAQPRRHRTVDAGAGRRRVNCEALALPAYWKRLSTAHFNVFHLALGDPLYDDYYRAAAEAIAAVVEDRLLEPRPASWSAFPWPTRPRPAMAATARSTSTSPVSAMATRAP